MDRGIIYSAVGSKYVAEAVVSARSSLRFNRIPHLIFCDDPGERVPGLEFRKIVSSGDPFLDKITVVNSSPFDQTLYLDTDTYVIGPISDLFDLLHRFDLAMAQAPGYIHSGDPIPSAAFGDPNTGVIVYRNSSETKGVLKSWLDFYRRSPSSIVRDQGGMRSAIWNNPRASIYVFGPEYNCRPIYNFRLVGLARIIHARAGNYEVLADMLNKNAGPRLFEVKPDNPITSRGLVAATVRPI